MGTAPSGVHAGREGVPLVTPGQWGLIAAAPLSIVGTGMLFLPLFWWPARGRRRKSDFFPYKGRHREEDQDERYMG